MRGVVLLLAAGGGSRLGSGPKAFVELAGVTLLRRSADAAAGAELVDAIVAAVPPPDEDTARGLLAGLAVPVTVVAGASTRQGSAAAAAAAVPAAAGLVFHDAARALCPSELFDRCLEALDDWPAVVTGAPVTDTIKVTSGALVDRTLDRASLVAAQTPQAVRADVYRRAVEEARRAGVDATDDVALVERLGERVRVVDGDPSNLKITTPLDLRVAEMLVRGGA